MEDRDEGGRSSLWKVSAEGRTLCTVQGSRCSGCIRGRTVPLCDAVSVKVEGEALEPPKIVGQARLSDDPTCVRGE